MYMLFQPHAGCLIKADIIFLLDVSGSVKDSFNEVIEFEREFVNNVTIIAPNHNQIGTIIFNDTAKTLFNLNTYESRSDVIRALSNLTHHDTGGQTNIVDGLCHVIHSFSLDNGARDVSDAVMRFVIVITDGQSNANEAKTCNLSDDVFTAAEEFHQMIAPAIVHVIGITDRINSDELKSIASDGNFQYLHEFKRDILIDAQQELLDSVCQKGIIIIFCVRYYISDCIKLGYYISVYNFPMHSYYNTYSIN